MFMESQKLSLLPKLGFELLPYLEVLRVLGCYAA
jgi:hypothetical protein